MGNWKHFKFFPLLNNRLVAPTIPIAFDDVVSSAFTMVVIGAATSVAAMQVKISLRIKWLLFLRLLDNLELFSLFRFRIPRRPKEPIATSFLWRNAQCAGRFCASLRQWSRPRRLLDNAI